MTDDRAASIPPAAEPAALRPDLGQPVPIDRAPSLRFALAARQLGDTCRRLGLDPPSFRSPPSLPGVDRTLHRRGSSCVVAVRVRGRPTEAVTADLIEGVVTANRLVGPAASHARAELWAVAVAAAEAA